MRSISRLLSTSVALAICGGSCLAQSSVALTEPSDSSTVVSQPDRDSHEEQATTRSVSQIRIVRLSQVRGQVQIGHVAEEKFEGAFTNLPIIAGEHLRTQEGVAEVEFEDNSSLRLTTDSQVNFVGLGRDATGLTTTTVSLVRGSIYISLANAKTTGDFMVRAGHETLTLAPSSHLRLDTNGASAKLTVFQGMVTAANETGSLVVGKRKAITFDLGATAQPIFAKLDEPSPFDDWDKNAVQYHKALAVASTYANSPYSYGVNDLSYYGAFSNVGGCGTMWRPYLATAAFDPYASGIWSYYPASGYSWVSPYPWGWTPYHSGSWNYCAAGGGWGWQPQGGWNGLQNVSALTTQQSKIPGRTLPHPPVFPPVKGQSTMTGVNLNKLQASKPGSGDSFVFQSGSAGFGVPRGVFGNLGKVSQHASNRGFAKATISEMQASRGLIATSNMRASGVGNLQSVAGISQRSASNVASAGRSSASSSSTSSSAASVSSASSMSHASGGSPASGGTHH